MTTADDHLLVLAVLLDQTLVQLHSFVLQFGTCILLDFPLSLLVVLLRIGLLESPRLHFVTLKLSTMCLLLLSSRDSVLSLVLLGALFLSFVAFPLVFGMLPVVLPLLLGFFLGAECVVSTSLDLLVDVLEHAVNDFFGRRRHGTALSMTRL